MAAGVMFAFCAILCSFHTDSTNEQLIIWSNKCLLHWFNPEPEPQLKKWELNVTGNYFLRFRRYYKAGRQEYYSFNLRKFKELDYLGNAANGVLCLSTIADDVIVQTYNDPKGNVDSMSTSVRIPVHEVEPAQLDSMRIMLLLLKNKAAR
ncbi:hypothetical protein [Mucilaginibacter sp.]